MQVNLSPSVNISRDAQRPFNYIETANGRHIFEQITLFFNNGVRTFSIVGSYGTGKSAFLLALTKHLSNIGQSNLFEYSENQFNKLKKFDFLSIIGESSSFKEVFAEKLGVENSSRSIFRALKQRQISLKKEGICYVIIVDEFGKFLEYATQNNPSVELYFLQELAEFVNDPDKNFLFLTTLHQNFDAYVLNETERKEWEKVKGRFKELVFNEPVEQLLSLASEFIKSNLLNKQNVFHQNLLNAISNANIFRLQASLTKEFAIKIFPFDISAAMALTVALQRYGQNERSLFSFLVTDEYLGLKYFNIKQKKDAYLNVAWVYDYLVHNFNSVITSKRNPDFFKWQTFRNAIERVYSICSEQVEDAIKLVKTIGLLDILGSGGATMDNTFLSVYGKIALNIHDTESLIKELEHKKILVFQKFKNSYKLFEGTDENIEQLLENERNKIQAHEINLSDLKKYINEQYHIAKAFSAKTGTIRVFEVKITDKPIPIFKELNKEIDGIVNFIFSKEEQLLDNIGKNEPILYGVYKEFEGLKNQLREIQATQRAINYVSLKNDTIAKQELEQWLGNYLDELEEIFNVRVFGEDTIDWYWNGKKIAIKDRKIFNKILSEICEKVYYATPEYRNELVNRVVYSSNVSSARKNFLTALFEKSPETNFGFDEEQMPPEKMIYITLCKHTRMFVTEGGDFECQFPSGNKSFEHLWQTSIDFLNSTTTTKRPLSELIEKLYEKPFRLKNGLVDFWILALLRGFRDDIAIFKNGNYIPKVGSDVAELFFKEAKNFEIKKFNVEGVRLQLFNKYRNLTKLSQEEAIKASNFQETAKPYIMFFKKLPKYTQETKSLSLDCLAFVRALKNAKDLEKLFFEDLPIAFGVNLDTLQASEEVLNNFIYRINISIAELRQAFDNLIERIEAHILNVLGIDSNDFTYYQKQVQERYLTIKEHHLFARHKSFLNRVKVQIDDRNAWLNSLSQSLMDKQLSEFTDKDEIILLDRLTATFKELDNLLTIDTLQLDTEKQEGMTVEITGTNNVRIKKNVILSKTQEQEVNELEKKIKKLLKGVNPSIYQAVLIRLLKGNIDEKY